MLQLMELGYTDYDKNLKLVKKENKKNPNISAVLDKLNAAWKASIFLKKGFLKSSIQTQNLLHKISFKYT